MARYLLDTHIAYWLVSEDPKLDPNLRDEILYPNGNIYFTSLHKALNSINVELDYISEKTYEVLEEIPILTINGKKHSDMIDRVIIANSIANKATIISHDSKFPHYRKYGLKLLEA